LIKPLFLVAVVTIALLAVSYAPDSRSKVSASGSQQLTLENFDIRTDASGASVEKLRMLRHGEELAPSRSISSAFDIENNEQLGIVETITKKADRHFLAVAGGRSRAETLKAFVRERDEFGIPSGEQLHEIADYTNPDGVLSFAQFEQRVGDVPVFGAEVTAGFTKKNEMFRVVNSLARGVGTRPVSNDFRSPETAVIRSASQVAIEIAPDDLVRDTATQSGGKLKFATKSVEDPIIAERFYFPVGNGFLRPAWRVLLSSSTFAYYVIVDAEDGTLLWRKNLMHTQSAAATFNVYGNTTSHMKTADSPSPFSPGCTSPLMCPQPPAVPRMSFTLVGNEAPYSFNNLGWIPDTGLEVRTPANPNITDGNNVEAGIDRMTPNGIDENGWATGSPNRVFSYAYNPAPGLPPPGEDPLPGGPQPYPPTQFQQGVITHAFHLANRWHDEMYRLGFTEAARNFQHHNFGRGGAEGDRVQFEVQDSSGFNGANHAIAADGTRSRVQMYIWSSPTPRRDGALDSQVAVHELMHGVSQRLHGNVGGLGSNMAAGMGEGWSDFYPLALMSEPSDDPLGTHAFAAYITYQIGGTFDANYYYGLRRFPYAVWASRGANGRPHNPLTFGYLNNNCTTLIGDTFSNPNSAFPRGPIGVATCDQIHNVGETWAVTLWEVRGQLVQRHGGAEGNRRVLQYVTDGMKLSPLNPTIIQARDSILIAATVADSGDLAPMWRGFAIRGLGANASIQSVGSGSNNTAVTESFAVPVQYRRPVRSDFDNDGRTDVSVFRPSESNWYLNRSSAGFAVVNWGLPTDEPVANDYDGDGRTDVAVFRATSDAGHPDFYILHSSTFTVSYISWGTTGDIAMSEDFDGDNKADPMVYRPSTGQFWVRRSTDGSAFVIVWGIAVGIPFVGDFDGDGRGDFARYNGGGWYFTMSGNNYSTVTQTNWGQSTDKAVPADYDGDGRDDIAVYRPSEGNWYIANSSGGMQIVRWGISTDVPVPGDYDGDGKNDIAVYRDGVWYINGSTGGVVITNFGLSSDQPTPTSYLP
jgi:hypothetical protein